MEIKVINIKHYEGDVNDYIYIGRPSKYGNPYSSKDSNIAEKVNSKKESMELFESYINEHPELIDDLIEEMELKNINILGCWCKTKDGKGLCHGDILIKKINEKKYKSII